MRVTQNGIPGIDSYSRKSVYCILKRVVVTQSGIQLIVSSYITEGTYVILDKEEWQLDRVILCGCLDFISESM